MKLIIIEGSDRTGKDTLINELIKVSPNVILRHFTTPKGKTNEEQVEFQKESFLFEFRFAALPMQIKEIQKTEKDLIIWNRSHLGEAVYSPLYRNANADWIFDMEKAFNYIERDDIYLIHLTADPEFIVSQDDGKSLSNTIDNRRAESELFYKAIHKSHIKNKLTIKVNDNNKYLPKSLIFEKVLKFINHV